jgi:type IV pilus assembly protein PilV
MRPGLPLPVRLGAPLRREGGVSLIEVLIAVVILGLGVLAVSALQLISKRNNSDAGARSQAAQLSYDILERMRMNNGATALTSYVALAGNGIGRGQQGSTEPSPNCRTASCTATQMATHDIWQFEQQLDGAGEAVGGVNTGGLVNPSACIAGPGGSGVYTIAIVWRGKIPIPDSGTTLTPCGDNGTDGGGNYLYGSDAECELAFGKAAGAAGDDSDCFRRVDVVQAFITARTGI